MKAIFYSVLFIITFLNVTILYPQYFTQPESVIYDENGSRYFVSNTGSKKVVQITDHDTSFTKYKGSRGMAIFNNVLYAIIDDQRVGAYDLKADSTIMIVIVSGAKALNDITADSKGFLYATDFVGNKIYMIDPKSGDFSILVSINLTNPNGILYDEKNNRLLLVESTVPIIKSVSLIDLTMITLVSNAFAGMDGITVDGSGNYYVSSWDKKSVYRYDKNFKDTPVLISKNHNGPAGIFFRQKTNTLAIPNFNSSSVSFVPVDVKTVD